MTTKQRILETLAKLRGPIRERWRNAVARVVRAATLKEVEASITVGDAAAITAAIQLTAGRLTATLEAIRDAYLSGGRMEAHAARIEFDIRNPTSERWLRENSSRFITNITEEQREAVRVVLEAGMEQGRNPNDVARDIVGRVGPGGRRRGGIVGLTSGQAAAVVNMRAELADPERMSNYFTRQRRDRRFDGRVRRAMEAERPLPQESIERLAARYADRLLALRGETIARTEAMQAFNAARDAAWEQSIEAGEVRRENVTKIWHAADDRRTRATHDELDGNRVPKGEPFVSISGARMMFPGDVSRGAPPSEIINCRCYYQVRADFLAEALG